jgi:tripartite-type tricarboxylate transporter receptor subunit TctC
VIWNAVAVVVLALLFAGASPGAADDYPSRPIRIIVPLPPGANGDLMPRILGQQLSIKLGQPVVIENRSGAAQNLGAEIAYRAEPDGYTLLATPQGPLVISPTFIPKLSFDPLQFVPITIMARLPYILGELLKLAAGIRMTHVPYAGLAPALNDLLAGHTDVMIDNLGSSLQFVRQGKLRALAVTSTRRIPELPELPPIADTYPEVVASAWFAVVAPPNTPPDIAQKLSQTFAAILREPEIEKRWRDMNLNAVGGTPGEIRAFFKEETERWRKVIVTGGIKPP